jgi:hypothetical protein
MPFFAFGSTFNACLPLDVVGGDDVQSVWLHGYYR